MCSFSHHLRTSITPHWDRKRSSEEFHESAFITDYSLSCTSTHITALSITADTVFIMTATSWTVSFSAHFLTRYPIWRNARGFSCYYTRDSLDRHCVCTVDTKRQKEFILTSSSIAVLIHGRVPRDTLACMGWILLPVPCSVCDVNTPFPSQCTVPNAGCEHASKVKDGLLSLVKTGKPRSEKSSPL